MAASRTVLAAGAVVWRPGDDEIELLVIHRPTRRDWSLPKGKVDAGELLPVTAVREVLEETSVPIRLGLPMGTVEYDVSRPSPLTKRVSYWVGRPLGDGKVTHVGDEEVDEVRWVRASEAERLLSYERDRTLVAQLLDLTRSSGHKTRPLIVLRHAHASARKHWKGPDRKRPLTDEGLREAHAVVPLLAAYGVRSVVTSSSLRCVQTVRPYAEHLGVDMVLDDGLSEEDADAASVARRLRKVVSEDRPTVVCTHRQVLPLVLSALGVAPQQLDPAGLVVVHRRRGRVVGAETHTV